jgi:hypothetical protein
LIAGLTALETMSQTNIALTLVQAIQMVGTSSDDKARFYSYYGAWVIWRHWQMLVDSLKSCLPALKGNDTQIQLYRAVLTKKGKQLTRLDACQRLMDRVWNLQEKETNIFIREARLLPRAQLSSAYASFHHNKICRLR